MKMGRRMFPKCVKMKKQNVLELLMRRGRMSINEIRFQLNPHHGCVYTPSATRRVCEALVRDYELIRPEEDVYALSLPLQHQGGKSKLFMEGDRQ